MQELTPEEFANILDEEGNLKNDNLTQSQKDALVLIKLLPTNNGAAMKRKCTYCNGTGESWINPNFPCPVCGGNRFV